MVMRQLSQLTTIDGRSAPNGVEFDEAECDRLFGRTGFHSPSRAMTLFEQAKAAGYDIADVDERFS